MSGDLRSRTGMSCEAAHEWITLLVYGELDDAAAHALEQHLASCAGCRNELEMTRTLTSALSLLPMREPSPSLLAQTRTRLDEALDAMPGTTRLARLRRSLRGDFSLLRTAPVAAAALLFAGVGLGAYGGYQAAHANPPASTSGTAGEAGSAGTAAQTGHGQYIVADVHKVTRDPDTGKVKVDFDRLQPDHSEGLPDDPQIRQLLLAGAEDRMDPAVESAAVSLLADDCQNRRGCVENGPARNALMSALRYDGNSEVRRKALGGLEPYVAEDTRVRDAVLESVQDDRDPAVRTLAINMLQPVTTDSSVQQVLRTAAMRDTNKLIRTASRDALQQSPEIQ